MPDLTQSNALAAPPVDTLESLDAEIAQLQGQIATAGQGDGAGPDYSPFFKSPGYQFRLDEGLRAIDRSASARGQLMSGGLQREITRYGQGLASSEFNNYSNRLASLAGIGQSATFGNAQIGSAAAAQVGQSANNIGNTFLAGGQAQAEGIVGSNNALLGGVQGALGSFNSGGGAIGGFGQTQLQRINSQAFTDVNNPLNSSFF